MLKFLLGLIATIVVLILAIKATVGFFIALAIGFACGAAAQWADGDRLDAVWSAVGAVAMIVIAIWLLG